MRRWTFAVVFLLVSLTLPIKADVGSSLRGGGTVVSINGMSGGVLTSNVELRDPTLLASESFSNGTDFAATWTPALGFTVVAGEARYAHNAGGGTMTQTSAAATIPWASVGVNGWFSLTYIVLSASGTTFPVCTIPNTFALTTQTLNSNPGTYTLVFQAMASTVGSFVLSCTSDAGDTIVFDSLSLKQVNGGNLTVQGRILVPSTPNATGAATPTIASLAAPTNGIYFGSSQLIGLSTGGTVRFYTDGSDWYSALPIAPSSSDTRSLGEPSGGLYWSSLYLTRSIQGSKTKNLTDAAAATPVIRVPVATYAGGEVIWESNSTDGADYRTTTGRIRFAGVNKAAALTCTINVVGTDLTASSNANTLVCTWTNVVNTTNCDLSVTCTDNTAGNQTMNINVRADMPNNPPITLTFP